MFELDMLEIMTPTNPIDSLLDKYHDVYEHRKWLGNLEDVSFSSKDVEREQKMKAHPDCTDGSHLSWRRMVVGHKRIIHESSNILRPPSNGQKHIPVYTRYRKTKHNAECEDCPETNATVYLYIEFGIHVWMCETCWNEVDEVDHMHDESDLKRKREQPHYCMECEQEKDQEDFVCKTCHRRTEFIALPSPIRNIDYVKQQKQREKA
ncbi:MAG: hypothetical protein ACTSUE_02000, partial [Promethearchaeota archaeon]